MSFNDAAARTNEPAGFGLRDETVLCSQRVFSQHKLFYLDLKRNGRGQFLKITEKDGRYRTTIIIPEEAIRPVSEVIAAMSRDLPATPPQAPPAPAPAAPALENDPHA